MKKRIRLILSLLLGTIALVIGVLYFNSTVTLIDRPFFLSGNNVTIVATRVEWMCNCANFIDTTNYKSNPVTEPGDNDYFFIEPAQQAQDLDHNHFIKNKYVRLTGQFYLDKGIPKEYELGHLEDKPNHARVFKFDKIEYLTDNRDEVQLTTKQ